MAPAKQRDGSVRKSQRRALRSAPRHKLIGFRPREPDRNRDFRRARAHIGIVFCKAAPGLCKNRREGATARNDPFALRPRWRARQNEPAIIGGEGRLEPGRAANTRIKESNHSPNRKACKAVDGREPAGIAQNKSRESLRRLVHGDQRRGSANGITDDDRLPEVQSLADAQDDFCIMRCARERAIRWRATLRWPIDRDDFKPIPNPGGEACEIAAAVTGGVQTQYRRAVPPTLDGHHTARRADVLDRFIRANCRQIL